MATTELLAVRSKPGIMAKLNEALDLLHKAQVGDVLELKNQRRGLEEDKRQVQQQKNEFEFNRQQQLERRKKDKESRGKASDVSAAEDKRIRLDIVEVDKLEVEEKKREAEFELRKTTANEDLAKLEIQENEGVKYEANQKGKLKQLKAESAKVGNDIAELEANLTRGSAESNMILDRIRETQKKRLEQQEALRIAKEKHVEAQMEAEVKNKEKNAILEKENEIKKLMEALQQSNLEKQKLKEQLNMAKKPAQEPVKPEYVNLFEFIRDFLENAKDVSASESSQIKRLCLILEKKAGTEDDTIGLNEVKVKVYKKKLMFMGEAVKLEQVGKKKPVTYSSGETEAEALIELLQGLFE